jgi:hypothetical protein
MARRLTTIHIRNQEIPGSTPGAIITRLSFHDKLFWCSTHSLACGGKTLVGMKAQSSWLDVALSHRPGVYLTLSQCPYSKDCPGLQSNPPAELVSAPHRVIIHDSTVELPQGDAAGRGNRVIFYDLYSPSDFMIRIFLVLLYRCHCIIPVIYKPANVVIWPRLRRVAYLFS